MFYLGPILRVSDPRQRLAIGARVGISPLQAAAPSDDVLDEARERAADFSPNWPDYERRQMDRRQGERSGHERAPLLDTRTGSDRRRAARPHINISV